MARKEKTEIILQNPSHLDNMVLARLKAVGMNHDAHKYSQVAIC
jgi:hypothetical protein